MNEEKIMMETVNEEIETEETMEAESSGGIGIGKILIGVGCAVVGGGVALFKNRAKLSAKQDEKRIKKLEKKGYVVLKAETEETVDDDSSEEVGADK